MTNTTKKYTGVARTIIINHSTGLVMPESTPKAITITKAIAQITAQNGSSGLGNLGAAGFADARLGSA